MQTRSYRPDQRVSEIVAEHPASLRIFEALRVDYCCGAAKTLAVAADHAAVDIDELRDLLRDDDTFPLKAPASPDDFPTRSLTGQVEHLGSHHHRFARRVLLRIDRLVHRVASSHQKIDHLPRLRSIVQELIDDLIPHMAREERYLFPYMRSLEGQMKPDDRVTIPLFGNLQYPLASITHDHADDSARLMELRQLTAGFDAGSESCAQVRQLFALLTEFERDLQEHIRLENHVVFPRAVAMEQAARDRATAGATPPAPGPAE
jgi:regulator of cell morphogenesis and NO signaling